MPIDAPSARTVANAQIRGRRTDRSNNTDPSAAIAETISIGQSGVRCQAAIAQTDSTTISSQERGQPSGSAEDFGLAIGCTICRRGARPHHLRINFWRKVHHTHSLWADYLSRSMPLTASCTPQTVLAHLPGWPTPERERRRSCGRVRAVTWPIAAALSLLQFGIVSPAEAQADRVDAGSFSVSQDGRRVGREQFSLRKVPAPDGSTFELRSESVSGERRVAVQLTTDSLGSPVRYSLEIREGTKVSVRAGGQRLRSRFTTQTVRSTGETVREYLLVPGLIVLEADFYHQLAFVLRGRAPDVGKTVELTALSLLDNTERQLRLSLETRDDSVTIAGAARPAYRWKLDDAAGAVRTLWSDASGRLLRVLIPSRSTDAVRDALPK